MVRRTCIDNGAVGEKQRQEGPPKRRVDMVFAGETGSRWASRSSSIQSFMRELFPNYIQRLVRYRNDHWKAPPWRLGPFFAPDDGITGRANPKKKLI